MFERERVRFLYAKLSCYQVIYLFIIIIIIFLVFLPFPGSLPEAYGGSQARGQIGAVVSSLHQRHSNVGSKPSLQPTPQLTATPDP